MGLDSEMEWRAKNRGFEHARIFGLVTHELSMIFPLFLLGQAVVLGRPTSRTNHLPIMPLGKYVFTSSSSRPTGVAALLLRRRQLHDAQCT